MSTLLKAHLALLVVAVVASLPVFPFQWHLTAHILGAILFVGGLVSSTLWMGLAHGGGRAAFLGFAANGARQVGLLLVGPAAVLALVSGLVMTFDRWGGWSGFGEHRWLEIALALFVAAVVLWGAFVHRYAVKLARLADDSAGTADGPPGAEIQGLMKRWYFWSGVVIALSVAILYLMAAKP